MFSHWFTLGDRARQLSERFVSYLPFENAIGFRFMHWYHHVLTGWWAFIAFYEENAYTVWLVWMNYFIHAVMYR